MSDELDEVLNEGGLFTCWCGAQGLFEDMFDFSDIEGGCGGSGVINCECGGDFCVCHNHGEYECPGCDDCESDDDYDDDFWDDESEADDE